jgi:hypothetical protein
LKAVQREQEVSRLCIQGENEENLSGFDEFTVMDRHPVRKTRKTRREFPILLAALQVYCSLWSHFGYVRLLLTKTFAKTLMNSEKNRKEILMDIRDLLILKVSYP